MKKFVLHTSHPAHFPWTYEPLSCAWPLSPPHHAWQLDHLHCFTLKGAALFCQPASFIYYWVWPITTNLVRTLHLYKEDWIKSSIYNPSLYKPCLSLFSPEHNLGCYLILCPRLQPFPLLKKKKKTFYSLIQIFFILKKDIYIFKLFFKTEKVKMKFAPRGQSWPFAFIITRGGNWSMPTIFSQTEVSCFSTKFRNTQWWLTQSPGYTYSIFIFLSTKSKLLNLHFHLCSIFLVP